MLKKGLFVLLIVFAAGLTCPSYAQVQKLGIEVQTGGVLITGRVVYIGLDCIAIQLVNGTKMFFEEIVNVRENLSKLDKLARRGQPFKIRLQREGDMTRIISVQR